MAITAIPILPVQSLSGNQWRADRIIEKASATFKLGTPVAIEVATGAVIAWDGTTGITGTITGAAIVGVSYEAASNLGSTGTYPAPFSPFVGVGATLSFGSVPNESSAKNIPH